MTFLNMFHRLEDTSAFCTSAFISWSLQSQISFLRLSLHLVHLGSTASRQMSRALQRNVVTVARPMCLMDLFKVPSQR